MTQAPALPAGFELPIEVRLPRIGSVDQVGVEERWPHGGLGGGS